MKWPLAAALTLALAFLLAKRASAATEPDPTYYADDSEGGLIEDAQALGADLTSSVFGSPADFYRTSDAMLARLKQREGLRLTRYRLGDGGWTIGYGRYFPDSGDEPPERIERHTAEAWFVEDVVEKGERWVKAYVSVPISQNQFDALVSMAYNLRPSSFKRIAEAVNEGQDPAPIAFEYTRPGTNLERGLIARRNEELGIFNGEIEA